MWLWISFLVYIIGIFLLGIPMAIKSIRVWRDFDEGIWGFVLFPFTTIDGEVGNRKTLLISITDNADQKKYRRYIIFSAMFWPVRICWSIVLLTSTAILVSTFKVLCILGKGVLFVIDRIPIPKI